MNLRANAQVMIDLFNVSEDQLHEVSRSIQLHILEQKRNGFMQFSTEVGGKLFRQPRKSK